ncbi:Part of AAA domain-containing protein [Nocardioides scoriae]|uniref:Part of AAA domain-containing protein n=1 Tax=Nocardioides scoriae TaxID=642780 RepID=A0A1H1V0U0_9ACTN|nr:UvrD-helicase domain-containing protein [Nocardioides scoriae]SDS78210.1 Part of AAA domain-containing protein [Nocardioides scoriae]
MREGVSHGLDAEQVAVAEAEPDARQIVLAAPGSGKTEVVAARVDALAELHDLDVVDEVLVLSFSRAAVAALRSRLGPRSARPLPTIRTIDSTATMLLDEVAADDWAGLDFDGRIERIRAVLAAGAASESLSLLGHVVVDEVQDLVGIRARFVLDLLRALPEGAGFTLLGDPRQALYDFQLTDATDMTARDFLDEAALLSGRHPVDRVRLLGQYRARSEDARSVASLGATDLDGGEWTQAVEDHLGSVLTMGDVAGVARPVARWPGTTAFLCRTNGDALVVAGVLRELEVTARLRPLVEKQPLETWVARAVSGSTTSITKTDVIDRLTGVVSDPEASWRLLKATERNLRVADRIDIARLTMRVDLGDFPAALGAGPGPVVVSTVHRAKGLEFDNVVVVDPDGMREPDGSSVAYVALTRARDRLVGAGLDRPRFFHYDKTTGRWIVGGHQRWMTAAIELRPDDIAIDPDIEADEIVIGGRVAAAFDRRSSTLGVPVWEVRSAERRIGHTTPAFGELVARRVEAGTVGSRWGWPDLAGGIGVEGVVTGVVRDRAGKPSLAAVPTISGLATFLR